VLGLCASLAVSGCGQRPPTKATPEPRPTVSPVPVATPTPAPAPTPEPSPSPTPPVHRDILGKKLAQKKKLYSQHNEELIIRDFFQDKRGGVFVDVGCAWPIKDSNTYFLEKELGWSGIGVDALPQYARAWANHRPKSRFFNYLVTDRPGPPHIFYRSDLSGRSSMDSNKASAGHGVKYQEIRVPTITLTKLLRDNHVARVDLLSIDIEGAELLALAGFDIARFRPQLVCIEWYHAGRDKVRAYFASHGYARIERYVPYDHVNDYYTPKANLAASGSP
jgi:FkbM family methyltransferase